MYQRYKETGNIYLLSRLSSGLSRQEAIELLHIDYETLGKYERGQLTPSDETVIAMSAAYNDPILKLEHLFEKNPIGRSLGWKIDRTDLSQCTLGFLGRFNDVAVDRDQLISIVSDGVIDDSEENDFDSIMKKSDRLAQEAIKLRFSAMYHTKEKTALAKAI
jgi:transcriptional regulator with XRE-family HTH domain